MSPLMISTNPLISRANAREVKPALEKVDFLVVQDFFLTPTGKEADYVLPAPTWLDHDYTGDMWKRHGRVVVRRKAVKVGRARGKTSSTGTGWRSARPEGPCG
ncbi:MAG: molybdopterin-dependent oxidoreductase [Pseudomonadota bacterium]